MLLSELNNGKPFLKWAGGKGQLINAIKLALPKEIHTKNNLTYIEPFVGSGAVMFWFLQQYKNVKKAVINDINPDLFKAYTAIKFSPGKLVKSLQKIEHEYYLLKTEKEKLDFFLEKRDAFNTRKQNDLQNTTLLIFLNRTCFNGLYRVNSENKFNVPFGRYIKPKICDAETILADSKVLEKVTILTGDFTKTLNYCTKETFFYFDPPYKPISKTSSFTSYSNEIFDNKQQERLKEFCKQLDSLGHQWLLSNSDLKNIDQQNNYFDELYSDYNIVRVKAKRSINSISSKRGEINELLISNYEAEKLSERA
jgi:DNA adenine methylase